MLDPTLARTYVGRIVFASICDKLFDIDAKLNVVPQLALSQRDLGGRQDRHHQAAAEREIPRRRAVRRRGREVLARPPPDHAGLVPQARARRRSTRSRWSIRSPSGCMLKAPFSPLIAQLTDRAGMMVSPKAAKEAGDKFGLKPVCAGPYKFVERVQQDRIVVEKFADYWDKDNVHIDRITYLPIVDCDRAARQPARPAALDLIERLLATDIKAVKRRLQAQARSTVPEPELPGHHHQRRERRQGEEPARPECQGAPGARAVDRPRRASTRSCSTASSCRATSGQPDESLLLRRASRSRSATSPRPRR